MYEFHTSRSEQGVYVTLEIRQPHTGTAYVSSSHTGKHTQKRSMNLFQRRINKIYEQRTW